MSNSRSNSPADSLPSEDSSTPRPKRERVKEGIIQGAVEALVQAGPGASTRTIASHAGVNLATLHYYFESKDALLLSAFEAINLEMSEAVQSGLKVQRDVYQSIEHILINVWNKVLLTLERQIVQFEISMYAARVPGRHSLARWQYEQYVKVYTDAFANTFEDGFWPRDLDGEGMARFILSGVDGLILQHLADPDVHRSWLGLRRLIYTTQVLASHSVGTPPPLPDERVFFLRDAS